MPSPLVGPCGPPGQVGAGHFLGFPGSFPTEMAVEIDGYLLENISLFEDQVDLLTAALLGLITYIQHAIILSEVDHLLKRQRIF